MRIMTRPPDLG